MIYRTTVHFEKMPTHSDKLMNSLVIFLASRKSDSCTLHTGDNEFVWSTFNLFIFLLTRISSSMYRKLQTESARIEQEELDIRCLQLLRAVIHNEERKLPEDWEENPQEHRK